MLPASSPLYVIVALLYAIAGGAIGLLAGLSAVAFTKQPKRLRRDAVIGTFGFLGGELACAIIPWPQNTITYRLSGGTEVSSTMNRYQHPTLIAVLFALLLPVLYEVYRLKRPKDSD